MRQCKLIKKQKGVDGDIINIYENTNGETFAMNERTGGILMSPEQILYKQDIIDKFKREIFELNLKNNCL